MRTLFRTLAAAAALSGVILATGAAPALAATSASDGASASVARYEYDDAWCFDDGWQVNCTVSHGSLAVTTNPNGVTIARIHFREQVASFQDGVQVGEYRVQAFDRSIYPDAVDGPNSSFTVSHLRARADGSSCTYTYVLKIVDFELEIEHLNGPTCS